MARKLPRWLPDDPRWLDSERRARAQTAVARWALGVADDASADRRLLDAVVAEVYRV